MHYFAILVGGGPAGLACARRLAEHGRSVLLLERKRTIGPKVCAGGITWSGLIQRVPAHLIEKSFPEQHIQTPWQRCSVREREPIIATVNRKKLGSHMADAARAAGVHILPGHQVTSIKKRQVFFVDRESGRSSTASCDVLIGADGAASTVRRSLGLPVEKVGVGINYQLPETSDTMEWHLDWRHFKNGYGWIFPHRDSTSIGAYVDRSTLSGSALKDGLLIWAAENGYDLATASARAELVNYDFRGWNFGKTFLIGEAAGLASGLTGEGIYPAIVSGEETASYIENKNHDMRVMRRLLRMHSLHAFMVRATGRSGLGARLTMETVTILLRSGIVDFRKMEMAH